VEALPFSIRSDVVGHTGWGNSASGGQHDPYIRGVCSLLHDNGPDGSLFHVALLPAAHLNKPLHIKHLA
jgi:hypothetical protein